VGFCIPKDAIWFAEIPGSPEVICHGDVGPYNTIYVETKAVALIDFETAAPGPRIWDLAFAVYRLAGRCELSAIANVSDSRLDEAARRIRRFCDHYGLEERTRPLEVVLQRLEFQIAWLHFCGKIR
jgi:thiamine kinase-like enzyme